MGFSLKKAIHWLGSPIDGNPHVQGGAHVVAAEYSAEAAGEKRGPKGLEPLQPFNQHEKWWLKRVNRS